MTRYRQRKNLPPPPEFEVYAAVYRQGQSLDELQAVARQSYGGADIAEVPSMGLLLVRYTVTGDFGTQERFEHVKDGEVLYWRDDLDGFFTDSKDRFNMRYEPDAQGGAQ